MLSIDKKMIKIFEMSQLNQILYERVINDGRELCLVSQLELWLGFHRQTELSGLLFPCLNLIIRVTVSWEETNPFESKLKNLYRVLIEDHIFWLEMGYGRVTKDWLADFD